MNEGISAYIPCFNNRGTIAAAVTSIRQQTRQVDELFVIDDDSNDDSVKVCESLGVRVIRQPVNLGRGAARSRAMQEAAHELVLCCDATNSIPPEFVEKAVNWFKQPNVAGVFGLITDPTPVGAVGRWRARHLFKADHPHNVSHQTPLITFGTMLRASAVAAVGGFNPRLRHSEDGDLGIRLLAAGFDVIGDPSLRVYPTIANTLGQVLERSWRWYAGPDERVTLGRYVRDFAASLKVAGHDLAQGDPSVAGISLLAPHYRFWKSLCGAAFPPRLKRTKSGEEH